MLVSILDFLRPTSARACPVSLSGDAASSELIRMVHVGAVFGPVKRALLLLAMPVSRRAVLVPASRHCSNVGLTDGLADRSRLSSRPSTLVALSSSQMDTASAEVHSQWSLMLVAPSLILPPANSAVSSTDPGVPSSSPDALMYLPLSSDLASEPATSAGR